MTEHAAATLTVRPLTPETWDAFAGLAERHNGVWGGCWCTWFHTFHAEKEFSYDANRALKERLVREGPEARLIGCRDPISVTRIGGVPFSVEARRRSTEGRGMSRAIVFDRDQVEQLKDLDKRPRRLGRSKLLSGRY